jgi:hypothetical protein
MSKEEELAQALRKTVAVLCTTRGHAGFRPCKFCWDLQAWVLGPHEEECARIIAEERARHEQGIGK